MLPLLPLLQQQILPQPLPPQPPKIFGLLNPHLKAQWTTRSPTAQGQR